MSKSMNLIMENWRYNFLLSENVSEKEVFSFLQNSSTGKIPEERMVAVLKELTKDPAFAEAVAFFAAVSDDELEEGALADVWSNINKQVLVAKMKGADAMEALQQAAPNASKLITPLLGVAFVAAMYHVKGDIDEGDIENGIKIAQKSLKGQELVDLAGQGGPLSENIQRKIN
jgi:hypothetical protein